jgi:hypothetical protein
MPRDRPAVGAKRRRVTQAGNLVLVCRRLVFGDMQLLEFLPRQPTGFVAMAVGKMLA